MRTSVTIILLFFIALACKTNSDKASKNSLEELSVNAQAKVVNWLGYTRYSFIIEGMIDNKSKDYFSNNIQELVSASNALIYSIPSEFRTDIMQEKVEAVVLQTRAINKKLNGISEEELKQEKDLLILSFNKIINEINYMVSNKDN